MNGEEGEEAEGGSLGRRINGGRGERAMEREEEEEEWKRGRSGDEDT